MKIYKIAQTQYNDIYDLFAEVDDQEYNLLNEYHNKKKGTGKNMAWQVASFPRLKKIWQDRVSYGFVRDEAGLDQIIDIFFTNLARVTAATRLAGHTEDGEGVNDVAQRHGFPLLDDEKYGEEFYLEFLNTQYESPITDYGLDPLWQKAEEILEASSYEEKLILVDQFLNIVHQNGDLAALFIEGGSSSLNELAGYEEEAERQQYDEEDIEDEDV